MKSVSDVINTIIFGSNGKELSDYWEQKKQHQKINSVVTIVEDIIQLGSCIFLLRWILSTKMQLVHLADLP